MASTPVTKSTGKDYVSSYKPTNYTTSTTGINGANTSVYHNPLSTLGVSNTTKSNTKSNSEWAKDAVDQSVKQTYTLNRWTPSTPDTGSSGGGGGGSVNYTPLSYEGVNNDDILNMIKSLLTEQKTKADAYHKTLYEQQLEKNRQAFENDRNNANLHYYRTNRYLKNLYGDTGNILGQGLSNQVRNNSNWINNVTSARQNRTNNDASALSNYNQNLSNTASTLAQGWYNYVLPVYTNRQQNLDDLEYRYKVAQF